nr:reverse transcriptase domain-containing protein [Tanacetum cinerariifolium]
MCRPCIGKFIIVYTDDIIIYSWSMEEHKQHLAIILRFPKDEKCVGLVTYQLEQPQELSRIHDVFYVSNLKKCLTDETFVVPLEQILLNLKLLRNEQKLRLKREAAGRAFEAQAEKDRTLMRLEELRFLATSIKYLDDDNAYWIKNQKQLIKNKMRIDLGDEDDEDE